MPRKKIETLVTTTQPEEVPTAAPENVDPVVVAPRNKPKKLGTATPPPVAAVTEPKKAKAPAAKAKAVKAPEPMAPEPIAAEPVAAPVSAAKATSKKLGAAKKESPIPQAVPELVAAPAAKPTKSLGKSAPLGTKKGADAPAVKPEAVPKLIPPSSAKAKKNQIDSPMETGALVATADAAPDSMVTEALELDIVVQFRAKEAGPVPTRNSQRPRDSRNRAKEPAPTAAPMPIDDEAVSAAVFRPAKRGRIGSTKAATPTQVALPVDDVDFGGRILDEDGLPVPQWRAKTGPAPANSESAEPSREQAGRERGGRRRRPSAPEDGGPIEQVAAPVAAPAVAERALKQSIPTPDAAPQIHLRNGVPTLVREHRVYPPLFFFGGALDDRRSKNVSDEMRMAADAGVHVHEHLIEFEVSLETVTAAIEFAKTRISESVIADPEAQVLLRLNFVPSAGWHNAYRAAAYRHTNGQLASPSVCDDEFWKVAEDCLRAFVVGINTDALRPNVLGVHLDRDQWFLGEGSGFDTSSAAQSKFRMWARQRYQGDEVTLHASWFDGSTRFDSIQIPSEEEAAMSSDKFIRASRKQRRFVDYHLFLSDSTVHRIGELAYVAKEASGGHFLVGVSYGYTFEWSHPASCHLSLGKLLRTPEIDFIAGPPSYRNREPGGAASFPCPIDSFALNGKLYMSEEDFKTSLAQTHEPDDYNPPMNTPQALESVHWRGAGCALSHGSGAIWKDLWGNGWLKTASVWARAAKVRKALITRMGAAPANPDVAVFIDERALAYLVDSDAFQLLVQNVRESVMRAGVSAAFYLLSDLAHREHFPDSKLYIFVNAWDVRPDLRAAIKERLQRDGKVLFWLYAAGLFDSGRESLERAREVTGIAIKPQPFFSKAGTSILNRRHLLSESFEDLTISGSAKLDPSYFAIPENAQVLGEYTQTGLPSFVVKEFNEGDAASRWTSVFLGEPVVTSSLIRALAQMAGVRVWNFQDDVVHIRAPFCTLHCTGNGMRALALPDKYSAYNLATQEWMPVEGSSLKFYGTDGATYCFAVGPKTDIEHLLSLDPAELLRMEVYPERDNNVRIDNFAFDVPIVKLDEWREGNESEDVSDEWFLRAPTILEDPEPAVESVDRIGQRRRRRRTGRGPGDDRQSGERMPIFADEEISMNVMFRKRD